MADVHLLADSVNSSVGRSPKDHHGGGLLLAFISGSIKEELGPLDRGGPVVDVYEPRDMLECGCPNRVSIETGDDELLRAYAPIIVQERIAQTKYDPSIDEIGTVRGVAPVSNRWGAGRRWRIEIDTTEPSVYAYTQHAWINGQPRLQLTYTHWFPEHPKLKAFDTEAGRIEGATLRITLDAHNKPAIFETVLNCGCYHRCYPTSRIEELTCEQHDMPLPGKRLCVERAVDGKMDWIVPEVVAVNGATSGRPILFSRAGWHGLSGVSFDLDEIHNRTVRTRRKYGLRCYEALERLSTERGFVSMFGPDGLVRGAGRLEGWLLSLTGMLSAGQPRQRGTQLLHWDQYDFDDPHLLEECLRLPGGF